MVLLPAILGLAMGLNSAPSPTPQQFLTPIEVGRHLRFFASPAQEGRLTLSDGFLRSAEYVESEMRKSGIKPFDKSYLHTYEITVNRRLGPNNKLIITTKSGKQLGLTAGKDYMPLANTSENPAKGELVYVGFGYQSDARNDFSGQDLTGKIAVMLRETPPGANPVANAIKAENARKAGAVGVLFVGPYGKSPLDIARTSSRQGLVRNSGIPGASVAGKFLNDLTGFDVDKAMSGDLSFNGPTGAKAEMALDLEPNTGKGINIVGVIPGNDPALKNQYIVLGGHLDHLGYGEVGSTSGTEEIHNGADDNASGASTVLALGEYFAKTRSNRRSILIQLYSGEEIGLVGSAAWVRDHPAAVAKIHLMVNLDMVGRLREGKLTVFGSNSAAELTGILGGVKIPGLNVLSNPDVPGNSDHASFVRAGVPSLFGFTGLHTQYHNEGDTIDTINFDGMALTAQAVAQIVRAADAYDYQFYFRKSKMTSGDADNRPTNEGRTRRVRTGFIPDMSAATSDGMLIQGVVGNSPAEKAGVKAGDKLVKFGEIVIKGIDDLQEALQKAEPGKPTTIVVIRDGKRVELQITPEAAG
ncbi:MAG: M28 family peptidase [Armatimonadetes bacterium]|nr:M28 family peptidase [Armatimonadota bacterium]